MDSGALGIGSRFTVWNPKKLIRNQKFNMPINSQHRHPAGGFAGPGTDFFMGPRPFFIHRHNTFSIGTNKFVFLYFI